MTKTNMAKLQVQQLNYGTGKALAGGAGSQITLTNNTESALNLHNVGALKQAQGQKKMSVYANPVQDPYKKLVQKNQTNMRASFNSLGPEPTGILDHGRASS
jgi:hypothetical protein